MSLNDSAHASPGDHAASTDWMSDVQVDRVALSALLKELGVHLDTELAPSFILATQDVLMCIELASSLPQGADFMAACLLLHTVSTEQPEPVRLVQQAVARHFLLALPDSAYARMRLLLEKLDL